MKNESGRLLASMDARLRLRLRWGRSRAGGLEGLRVKITSISVVWLCVALPGFMQGGLQGTENGRRNLHGHPRFSF